MIGQDVFMTAIGLEPQWQTDQQASKILYDGSDYLVKPDCVCDGRQRIEYYKLLQQTSQTHSAMKDHSVTKDRIVDDHCCSRS